MFKIFKTIAAIVDVTKLTLYSPSGDMLVIPQGDPRVELIVNVLKLTTPSVEHPVYINVTEQVTKTPFDEFTDISTKKINFYRIGNELLDSLWQATKVTSNTVIPESFGSVSVLDQIMAQTVPTGSYMDNSTIFALVDDVVIPGVENIIEQIKFANQTTTVGIEAFLTRLTTVAAKRKHSIEDLMKFLKEGDLPIADDGSIIAYKLLFKRVGEYVDCHTQKVTQRVGDFVNMHESLVNTDRRQDCSNGLHVARRDYLGGFSGDICTLIKIAPEDVIAVPQYDGSKMRVCGYHIIFELPSDIMHILRENKSMTNHVEGANYLAKAISGEHIGITRKVTIGGHLGTAITIEDLTPTASIVTRAKEVITLTKSEITGITKAAVVKPSSIISGSVTRLQTVKNMFKEFQSAKKADKLTKALELKNFKRASKVSWDRLGLSQTESALIENMLQN